MNEKIVVGLDDLSNGGNANCDCNTKLEHDTNGVVSVPDGSAPVANQVIGGLAAVKEALAAAKGRLEACLKEALGVEHAEAEVDLDGNVSAVVWIEGEEDNVATVLVYQFVVKDGELNVMASKRYVQGDAFGPLSVLIVPIALTSDFISSVKNVIDVALA